MKIVKTRKGSYKSGRSIMRDFFMTEITVKGYKYALLVALIGLICFMGGIGIGISIGISTVLTPVF